ncbi:MAG: ATP-binding cassette domain-containing protein [Candidatus Levybacteria bacterium]|nr:ATP-binding cassette domain-containing protein [Candidatus Levybacteria bacterium]
MPIIEVNHLAKSFKVYRKEPGVMGSMKSLFARKHEFVHAVDDVSFSIDEGELIGFIGPNGAGKTTTLKCLSGLLYPTSGDVKVLGYNPFDRKNAFLKQISLVMGQKNQLWWDLPAMESLVLNREIYEIPRKRFDEVVEDLSQILHAKDFLHIQVRNLSLGQRMKMELMAALIHTPKVLFLDEPTIGLDVVMQKNLREFIKEYNLKYNATIILTSHYMADVEALCKRVIVINHGKVLFDGLLTDLIAKHATEKIVSLTLSKKVSAHDVKKFGEVKAFTYPELKILVSRDHLQETISKIMREVTVDDIKIEDQPIEDIIRELFERKREK